AMHGAQACDELLVRLRRRAWAEKTLRLRLRIELSSLLDEGTQLLGVHNPEARTRVREHERAHALRVMEREVARDAPAHRKSRDVRLTHAEVIEHAQEVGAKHREIERALVVLRLAVAARVPGGRPVVARKEIG